MNERLPKGWINTNLNQVVLHRKGKKPKKTIPFLKDGYIPYILIDEMEGKSIRAFTNDKKVPVANENDILIVWDGSIGKTATGIQGAIGSTIAALTPIVISPNFLYAFLQLSKTKIEQTSRGTGLQHINPTIFWSLTFPLPPLNEQEHIASKLDQIMLKIYGVKVRLDLIPQLIKRFLQSVLTAAVTGKLTEKWREEHPDIKSAEKLLEEFKIFRIDNAKDKRKLKLIKKYYSESEIRLRSKRSPYNLPETWKFCEINNIGDVFNGSTPSRKVDKYWGNDFNWVSSGEVQNCVLKKTNEKISQLGFENSSVKLLPKGTVLIAMIGEGRTRGQSAILDIEATCNQNVAAVIINHNCVLPKYLFYWFLFQYDKNRRIGSGSGPKALNCQRVRELDFVLPPIEEQCEIVRQVDKLFSFADKLEAHHKKAKEKLDKLSQSVLAKAFQGKLVPQDPSDEPAEKLLERIKEEKTRLEIELKKMRRNSSRAHK